MKTKLTACFVHISNKLSRNALEDNNDDLFNCSCFKSKSEFIECINELIISIAAYVTAKSLRRNDCTTFCPIISRNLLRENKYKVYR